MSSSEGSSEAFIEMSDKKGDKQEDAPKRDNWGNQVEFILACIGLAVGLGNVWRFPYLCYKNGGGAFLIPYIISMVCCGIPIFFLEVSIGQFMSLGGWEAWKICPLFQGVSLSATVIAIYSNIYYNIILAWAVFYCVNSFQAVVPWSHCDNYWNTVNCTLKVTLTNCTLPDGTIEVCKNSTGKDPVLEFWENHILQISDGIGEPGTVVWQLALSLLFCWVLCYFSIWKGVKWTGKVVYIIATLPYIIITILLINGARLDGAIDGVIFYLKPDFRKLASPQVWYDAGTQVFYSYAIGFGALTAYGSYNKFNNNMYKQCVTVAIINSCTSLYAGFSIFTVLGFMAKQQNLPIKDVASSGPGLAFIAYPKSIAQMPVPQLWSCLFFLMILLLGLGSQFACCEGIITTICDFFPQYLRKSPNREIFTACYFTFSYCIGLTMITKGGMYVFQLFDNYAVSGFCLLWVCFFEVIAIAWVYGANRFYKNIEMMIGYRILPWMKLCWLAIAPIVIVGIFLFAIIRFQPLVYNKTYVYPGWANGMGVLMALSSMSMVPIVVVYKFVTTPGTIQERFQFLCQPVLKPHQLPSADYEKANLMYPKNDTTVTFDGAEVKIANNQ